MTTRLGSIAYINSLPVDLGLLSGAVLLGEGVRITQDVPQGLNARVLAGELDITPVSALHYAQNADKLVLLPDLSVSSESGVQSVLLFSRRTAAELGNARVRVTDQGKTTPALLRILLELRYGHKPVYVTGPSTADLRQVQEEAVLLIGDDALRAADSPEAAGWRVTDLSTAWQEWTGRPFVFAVWTARREFWSEHPEEVRRVLAALLESRRWAAEHESELIAEAGKRSGFTPERLRRYYRELRFDLDVNLVKGMMEYFDRAVRVGALQAAPKLEWLPTNLKTQTGAKLQHG
jgi:chorismate dehydratase